MNILQVLLCVYFLLTPFCLFKDIFVFYFWNQVKIRLVDYK